MCAVLCAFISIWKDESSGFLSTSPKCCRVPWVKRGCEEWDTVVWTQEPLLPQPLPSPLASFISICSAYSKHVALGTATVVTLHLTDLGTLWDLCGEHFPVRYFLCPKEANFLILLLSRDFLAKRKLFCNFQKWPNQIFLSGVSSSHA